MDTDRSGCIVSALAYDWTEVFLPSLLISELCLFSAADQQRGLRYGGGRRLPCPQQDEQQQPEGAAGCGGGIPRAHLSGIPG